MDYFRDFEGFGSDGVYKGHWKLEPKEVATKILEEHRRKKVLLEYSFANENPRSPAETFAAHEQWINSIAKHGSLDYIVQGNPDNIIIKFPNENKIYEIQRIVIADQFVTELRDHSF